VSPSNQSITIVYDYESPRIIYTISTLQSNPSISSLYTKYQNLLAHKRKKRKDLNVFLELDLIAHIHVVKRLIFLISFPRVVESQFHMVGDIRLMTFGEHQKEHNELTNYLTSL
jgi:hypothetical protein